MDKYLSKDIWYTTHPTPTIILSFYAQKYSGDNHQQIEKWEEKRNCKTIFPSFSHFYQHQTITLAQEKLNQLWSLKFLAFLPISTSFILYKPFSSLQGKAFLDNRFWKEPPLTSCKIQMSHLSPYYGLDTPNIATRPLVRGQLLHAGSPASNHHHILAPIHSLVVSYNGVKVCQKL